MIERSACLKLHIFIFIGDLIISSVQHNNVF